MISVAAILMMGRAVERAGLTEPLARMLGLVRGGAVGQNMALFGSTALLSGIMNNTGTLAILMPLTIRLAREAHRVASKLLMPLAFASLLGGLITIIGTPPNILVAQIRAEHMGEPFRMFDYTPVGLGLTIVGVVFLSLVGWRLLPVRRGAASTRGFYRIGKYFAEVMVPEDSRLVGQPLASFGELEVEVNVVGLIRSRRRILAPSPEEILEVGDGLLVEATGDELQKLLRMGELEIGADRRIAEGKSVTPAFLFAALLWEPVRLAAHGLGERGVAPVEALHIAASDVFGKQAKHVALPKRFAIQTREIWTLQPRFLNITGKRPERLLGHPRFRAAYDFLCLRAESGEADKELAGWWTEFQRGRVPSSAPAAARRRPPRVRRPKGSSGESGA